MKRTKCVVAFLVAAMIGSVGVAFSAEKIDLGRREYRDNCLNCHGEAGDGNGPFASLLKKPASDLTRLTKSNKGVFPFARVYEAIDGRQVVKGHGESDMPIWGSVYRGRSGESSADTDYSGEHFVLARILALIEYISRLQKS